MPSACQQLGSPLGPLPGGSHHTVSHPTSDRFAATERVVRTVPGSGARLVSLWVAFTKSCTTSTWAVPSCLPSPARNG